jgi:hypothetical protein
MNEYVSPLAFANRQWSSQEISIAAAMYQGRFTDIHGEDGPARARTAVFDAIAQRLKRNHMAVWQRFRDHGPSFNAGGRATTVSSYAMAERSARAEASYLRDLTASVFGDPPPGYSALDRRQQGPRR